jgi:hypothetical protein
MNTNIPDFRIKQVESAEDVMVQVEKQSRNSVSARTAATENVGASAYEAKKPSGERASKFGFTLLLWESSEADDQVPEDCEHALKFEPMLISDFWDRMTISKSKIQVCELSEFVILYSQLLIAYSEGVTRHDIRRQGDVLRALDKRAIDAASDVLNFEQTFTLKCIEGQNITVRQTPYPLSASALRQNGSAGFPKIGWDRFRHHALPTAQQRRKPLEADPGRTHRTCAHRAFRAGTFPIDLFKFANGQTAGNGYGLEPLSKSIFLKKEWSQCQK